MCGILGSIGFGHELSNALNGMMHRGPDDSGEFVDTANRVYLGHRRLSILDLSPAGRQPMHLRDPGLWITYNGEVYNFQDLRRSYFPDAPLQSGTDTEIILHLYRKFGYEAPKHLRGMFSFGIYDCARTELYLARDRLGIKPLYYYANSGQFAFASELEALKQLPGIDLQIDPVGLDHYFTQGYIPAPFSAYKHIRKLRPGEYLVFDVTTQTLTRQEHYWRLPLEGNRGSMRTEQDWIHLIEDKIREAVQLRLVSDVPLGAFLSGGLDSSLLVSIMAGLLDAPVKTFTIGFDYGGYDERAFAEMVASRYATEHFTEVVTPSAIDVLPKLVRSFGEPFSDPSAIPTYYVSQMARKNVTVVLSGDGGDEILAGYDRYSRMHRYAKASVLPARLRRTAARLGRLLPRHIPGYGFLQRLPHSDMRLYEEVNACFPETERGALYRDEFRQCLAAQTESFYEGLLAECGGSKESLITRMQLIDLHAYMPEDILTKVDRMSMLHSIETRVPFIDHEVVETAFACPPTLRYKNGTLKYITKSILKDKVDSRVISHKKQGFSVPLAIWFRHELKGFMQDLLHSAEDDPYIRIDFVRDIFDIHLRGGRDFSKYLYAILFYLYWRHHDQEIP